jgi:hypothetical protein
MGETSGMIDEVDVKVGVGGLYHPSMGETPGMIDEVDVKVGVGGLEPPAPASQTRCAANCATPRTGRV